MISLSFNIYLETVSDLALHQCELLLNVMFNNLYYVKRTSASINRPEELTYKATLLKFFTKLFAFSSSLYSCFVMMWTWYATTSLYFSILVIAVI